MVKIHGFNVVNTGRTGALANKITDRWLLDILESNPAVLEMFRQREIRPYRDMLPWSGEFDGKYLTSDCAV